MASRNGDLSGNQAATTENPLDYSDLLHTPYMDAFAFSEREQLALDLYDQLGELELQRSLLEAQNEATNSNDVSELSERDLQEQLTVAEREAMEAKAEYELRNRITRNVLAMDPVLKAVHGGESTDYAEKRMLPLIAENDVVSMVHGHLTSKLVDLNKKLRAAEQGNITANERNRALANELLALAERMKAQNTEDIEDPQLREKVRAMEREVKASKRRMRNLKGILSGMIVGSGINWAEDEVLRELVMDDEDDG
ncbi:uncharacterized protein EI97DRAFT_447823 [Westerdykella ornata]|uniref:Centromere protein H C-terminal domain-containing protein n=1 Tax=Westerdykella ornata TaxID=318751 RepID=A0A6A6JVL4_WESOR|nr:uncharacterized protein EI97DRAFT_447823 [Westerdykella ornata]KAF2280264.1 hypothetical protein EI97DRAFT_447823 [Westerdykella ornata]